MQTTLLPRTQNENILIQYKDSLFSENIYAWFDYGMIPVFSNKIEDLMLPEDYVIQQNHFANGDENENVYEIFAWSNDAGEHIYTGRLYTPKNSPKLA